MTDFFAQVDPGNPQDFPIGTRVIIPTFEDHHFFKSGSTGIVIRHADHPYLGVIVKLDQPFMCNHGHYEHKVEEFNFNARDLAEAQPPIQIFQISQSEMWSRSYFIQSRTVEEAKQIYGLYLDTFTQPDTMTIDDPIYIEDMAGDIVIFDEDGSIIEEHRAQNS